MTAGRRLAAPTPLWFAPREIQITADFDYDNPPLGGMVNDDTPDTGGDADDALILKDHKIYPRDPENLPSWHPACAGSAT